MATITGELDGHLDVTDDTTVQGAIKGGAVVHPHAHLLVQGAVAGPLRVLPDGMATVQGSFTPDPRTLIEGVLIVAGVITGEVSDIATGGAGGVAVAVGSVMTTDRGVEAVRADGSVVNLGSGPIPKIDVDAGRVCIYDPASGAFRPASR